MVDGCLQILFSETINFMGKTPLKTQMSPVDGCFEHWGE